MVDPYAPPTDAPAPRTHRTAYGPTVVEPAPAPPVARDPVRPRTERPWRDTLHDEPHTEPARPGLFWTVAAIGVGLLCLARLVLFFAVSDAMDGDLVAPAFVAVLGVIALSAGLALAALLQRGLATSWRIALLLGAGFFAIAGNDVLGLVLV